MKVIDLKYTPRRTGLMDRIKDARDRGVKSVLLTTAADTYGAINIQGQVFRHRGVRATVRRVGNQVRLFLDAKPKKPGPGVRSHTNFQNKVKALRDGECLLLTTPLEVHSMFASRQTLKHGGTEIRCKRNCTNLMVWKTRQD